MVDRVGLIEYAGTMIETVAWNAFNQIVLLVKIQNIVSLDCLPCTNTLLNKPVKRVAILFELRLTKKTSPLQGRPSRL